MRFFKKYLPNHETIRNSNHLRWVKQWLGKPQLWHFNRNTVARGVAIGLVAALIPLPLQMLLAVLFCIWLNANIPVAVVMTWLTNPFTMLPVFWIVYKIGAWITGQHLPAKIAISEFHFADSWQDLPNIGHHFQLWVGSLGKNFFVGLPIVALIAAFTGYGLVQLTWRLYLYHQLYRRRQRYTK